MKKSGKKEGEEGEKREERERENGGREKESATWPAGAPRLNAPIPPGCLSPSSRESPAGV